MSAPDYAAAITAAVATAIATAVADAIAAVAPPSPKKAHRAAPAPKRAPRAHPQAASHKRTRHAPPEPERAPRPGTNLGAQASERATRVETYQEQQAPSGTPRAEHQIAQARRPPPSERQNAASDPEHPIAAIVATAVTAITAAAAIAGAVAAAVAACTAAATPSRGERCRAPRIAENRQVKTSKQARMPQALRRTHSVGEPNAQLRQAPPSAEPVNGQREVLADDETEAGVAKRPTEERRSKRVAHQGPLTAPSQSDATATAPATPIPQERRQTQRNPGADPANVAVSRQKPQTSWVLNPDAGVLERHKVHMPPVVDHESTAIPPGVATIPAAILNAKDDKQAHAHERVRPTRADRDAAIAVERGATQTIDVRYPIDGVPPSQNPTTLPPSYMGNDNATNNPPEPVLRTGLLRVPTPNPLSHRRVAGHTDPVATSSKPPCASLIRPRWECYEIGGGVLGMALRAGCKGRDGDFKGSQWAIWPMAALGEMDAMDSYFPY